MGVPSILALLAFRALALAGAIPHVRAPGTAVLENPFNAAGLSRSEKYLFASFPNLRQVAYVRLPDNVWRPLVIGDVLRPEAIAIDEENDRLFVADIPRGVVWWYKIKAQPNGLLETQGGQRAAVEGYSASGLAVNGVGDLFFTGHEVVAPPQNATTCIFKQNAFNINTGDSLNPTLVYSPSNTGVPNAKVSSPSGIAVDSFNIYWGNEDGGQTHGALVKGSRLNAQDRSRESQLLVMNDATHEVRGVTCSGTHVFFLSLSGVYGVAKTTPVTVHSPAEGLIATGPGAEDVNSRWDPVGIAWDGDNSLYLTDSANGLIYTLPAQNVDNHSLTKFVDSPNIHGLAIGMHSGSMRARSTNGLVFAIVLIAARHFVSAC